MKALPRGYHCIVLSVLIMLVKFVWNRILVSCTVCIFRTCPENIRKDTLTVPLNQKHLAVKESVNMPSYRDRSVSPRRDSHRHRERDDHNGYEDREGSDRDREKKQKRRREATPSDDEDKVDLKQLGVEEITEEDYLYVFAGNTSLARNGRVLIG